MLGKLEEKQVKVLAGDNDAKELTQRLRKRGIRGQIPKRAWKKTLGRPIDVPRYQVERVFSWFQRKFRRLTVRWERTPLYFEAFLCMAVVFMWIQRLLVG